MTLDNKLINEWMETGNKKLIKKILKTASAKEFYKKCKEMYRITHDKFYIKSMRKINFYYYLKSFYFLNKHKKDLKKIENIQNNKAENLSAVLKSICPPENAVYIMQYSFFDPKGENYFSGGGERYACDLAKIIKEYGYTPILIQCGSEEQKELWVKNFQDLTVIGVNSNSHSYFKIINKIPSPKLTIYSGCINWDDEKPHHPSILISHGITWDHPMCNANVRYLSKILNIADTFVSVDTNTISWFRSTFSKTIADSGIKMQYVPNYVDLKKYTPKPDNNLNKTINITFPRRCSDERGFWLLADIIPDILDKYYNVEFNLVGFAHTPKIGEKICDLQNKYPNRIKHKVVDADNMHEIYQDADISLIPTLYSEGTSLSCIEAMASGNAIISTDIGGLPNLIINNYNGLLVGPYKKDIQEAIEKLIVNKNLREKLSKNAVEVAQEFSKKNWDNNWKNILKNSLEITSIDAHKDDLQNSCEEYRIKGLNLFVEGKNNVIDIDKSAEFFETVININANNSYIKIGKVKYIRCSEIFIYNGDNQSLIIDDGTSIEGINIYCCDEGSKLNIGKNCMLAHGISIWTGDGHTIIDKNTGNLLNPGKNTVIIGDNTWIAQDCKLLKHAQIAPNCIVGANSIVTKKFDNEYVLLAGNPAKIMKDNVAWNRQAPFEYEKRKNV